MGDSVKLELHRCKVCGTRWLLWPDGIHGGGWNLLDKYSKPGGCCDNVAMGEQIEHLRDIPLSASLRPQEAQWEPIETCPRDGTWHVLTSAAMFPVIGQWSEIISDWQAHCLRQAPTHWMPLPSPPADHKE